MKFLTKAELVDLTGAQIPSKQKECLRSNGILFVERSDGHPAVLWESVNAVLVPQWKKPTKSIEPNLSAI